MAGRGALTRFRGFPPETLEFLVDLAKNNDRDWFQRRKAVYEEKVKAPLVELVQAIGDEMAAFAPRVETDPRKTIYRIYRDTRFSKNKAPYKPHVAASFYPAKVVKHAGAGYYFHISPTEFLIGGGVYMPGSAELLDIRRRLSARAEEYRRIVAKRELREFFGEVAGERLKRIPKGFSADDPAADLLVHKQWLAGSELDPKIAETRRTVGEIVRRFRALANWIDFLNGAA